MKKIKIVALVLTFMVLFRCNTQINDYELIVYGATPGGIITAVTAADHGVKVLLIEPMPVIGGMSTSGLNTAESEHMIDAVITGRARDFYMELGKRYYDSAYFQTFGNGRGLNFKRGDPAFFFESKHAQTLYEEMIEKAGVELITEAHLLETFTENARIQRIKLSNGQELSARYFADCSYEGDLMAQAGVSYTFGREPISQYNESLAGFRLIDDTLAARTVDENGNLLPYFNRYDTLIPGSGDQHVMNYNFRPTMTEVDSIKVPITRPERYDSTRFNFFADFLAANPETHIWDLVGRYLRGSGKFEYNNQQKALVSLGMFGANKGYTDGDWETRQHIYQEHKDWTLGFLYFLATDPRVPEKLREETSRHGFAKDEFVENGNFPYYLYVREGRRMIGPEVHTQHDVFRDRQKEETILLGSHWVDSHHVQRIALSDSTFTNEGRIWEIVLLPFEISYRVITPKKEECENLLVPVCASFSHVAFCTYRLESTWMQAGHAAGLATVQALAKDLPVQDISIPKLQEQLITEGMVIEAYSISGYDDYEWLKRNQRYGERYKRMYEEYGVELVNF
jgi:hypothetical protein